LARERETASEVVARVFIADTNLQNRAMIEQAGFQVGKRYFQMQIKLESPLPEPDWPEGISVRTAIPGQDDRAIYELIQAAFVQPDRTPQPFEDWKNSLMWPNTFEPELWFLATAGDELVGASLCLAYDSLGWVRQLGVLDSWRRKGIGATLLRHTFAEFKKRGFNRVGLAVESKRPDAYIFYQRIGMQQVRQYNEYVKPLTSD
jgi:GNAT superfamily N-acetyltransferase